MAHFVIGIREWILASLHLVMTVRMTCVSLLFYVSIEPDSGSLIT